MATSLISMLNRLPIYNRPKEPAIGIIGNPVLVETSNASLATLPTIPIQPKYDHFGNLITPPSSTSNPNNSKKLPPLPRQSESPPVKYTPFHIPSKENLDAPARATPPPSSVKNSGASQPTLIQRKPAPPAGYQNDFPDYNPSSGLSQQSYDPRITSVDDINWLTGKRRTTGRAAPPIAPATVTGNSRGIVRHQSIDDWMNKRQTEQAPPPPLKVQGRTSPPRPLQRRVASASAEPPKLAIRQSVFAPFDNPPINKDSATVPRVPSEASLLGLKTPPSSPPRTKIPKPADGSFQSSRRYESASSDILKSLGESLKLNIDLSEPAEAEDKDHITELEETREQLVARRISTNHSIYNLEQALVALPYSSPDRHELKQRVEQKKQELADIEKEIFDTGMLIHRAWKRKVKKDGVERPTHLWVHNVATRE